jgi:hypothetical protein
MSLKTPITELDFFRVKNQLKEYLRADPADRFKDFDFEGSNMSVLLDVLAYNTYQNNFYTNMAISEMFLDTAQMENSVVSHAKELNYLPRSSTSAVSSVNISISDTNSTSSTIVIPENTRFTTTHAGDRYNFFTNETYIARKDTTSGKYVVEGVDIFEGEIVDEAFFVTGTRNTIRLLNQNIDTSSIKVFESFDEPLDRIEYVYRGDIFGVAADDPVFYIEPSFDSTYEIIFGNNRFGRTPAANEQIRVIYRLSSGTEANGACRFSTAFKSNVTVTTVTHAAGGAEKETIEDTKFFAPRSIQIQERAVTERDYEVLLKQRFNEIRDISVYGGDELDPPRYGKVAISVNLDGGLSEAAARNYEVYLRDKTPVAIQPIFLPPEFLYVTLSINLFYSPKQTSQSKSDLEQAVREVLTQYNITSLEKFGAVFEVSRASTLIDNSNASITSNTLDALPYILYSPEFKKSDNPKFDFGTSLASQGIFLQSNNTLSYNTFVRSSVFVYDGINAIFEDDGLGIINIINEARRNEGIFDIIRRNVGTVDYKNGIARLSDFVVDSYAGAGIRVSANTQEKNVSSPKGRVLVLKDEDVTINVVEIR